MTACILGFCVALGISHFLALGPLIYTMGL